MNRLSILMGAVMLTALLPAQQEAPARLHGICFGPFREGESPEGRVPLPSTLREDVAAAAKVAERLRTYGMGGGGWLVPELCEEQGLKCWPGAWLGRDRAANDRECELLIRAARRHPAAVEAVFVGNEVLLRGDLTSAQLRARIDQVRDASEVPVTTAEPWKVWLDHPELIAAVDIVTVHVHPYWDKIAAADAPAHTLAKLDEVRKAAGDKPVVLGEFGWPTDGAEHGAAVPSVGGLRYYLQEVVPALQERGQPFFLFEVWDEAWKAGDEGSVGPHWGIYGSNGQPKFPAASQPWLTEGASRRPPRPTVPLQPAAKRGAPLQPR